MRCKTADNKALNRSTFVFRLFNIFSFVYAFWLFKSHSHVPAELSEPTRPSYEVLAAKPETVKAVWALEAVADEKIAPPKPESVES